MTEVIRFYRSGSRESKEQDRIHHVVNSSAFEKQKTQDIKLQHVQKLYFPNSNSEYESDKEMENPSKTKFDRFDKLTIKEQKVSRALKNRTNTSA